MKTERIKLMKKKIYSTPFVEVETIKLSSCLLDGSPEHPIPPLGPGAPKRRTPVF